MIQMHQHHGKGGLWTPDYVFSFRGPGSGLFYLSFLGGVRGV